MAADANMTIDCIARAQRIDPLMFRRLARSRYRA
jgi:hypothetical protein